MTSQESDHEVGTEKFTRIPTVLVIDTSGGMKAKVRDNQKSRISKVNTALGYFERELNENPKTRRQVDLSIVTYGGKPEVAQEFTPAESWSSPILEAKGISPLADGIDLAIDTLAEVREVYIKNKIPYKHPFIWLLTNNRPMMDKNSKRWKITREQLDTGTSSNYFQFCAVCMGSSEFEYINDLVNHTECEATVLQDYNVEAAFDYIKTSLVECEIVDKTRFDHLK